MKIEENEPYWTVEHGVPADESPLLKNDKADVCVVGAGIAGMTTAYLLANQGMRVAVVSQGGPTAGETPRSSAHLSNAIEQGYRKIESLHGEEGASIAANSHTLAIDQVESICSEEGIDCGFQRVDGFLYDSSDDSAENLKLEFAAASRCGILNVRMLDQAPIPSLSKGGCIHYPSQAQLNPAQYLIGLRNAFKRLGGKIYLNTRVDDISGGSPCTVTSHNGFEITCDSAVVATNTPCNDRIVINTKQSAYRTYVLGFEISRHAIPTALYWDNCPPFRYIRTASTGEHHVLLVGGGDHRTGQAKDESVCLNDLEKWARTHFPFVRQVVAKWSGQIENSVDGLAYIGRNPMDSPNVYIATGDSGMGMTHGTIAGQLLTDLILDRSNEWAKIYDPSRKKVAASLHWLEENTNTLSQYFDYFTKGEVDYVGEISPGEGAILRDGARKYAVYRDEHGATHVLSSMCPHLGGIVHWNQEAKTWDCPCHGSRFTAMGEVINGPATEDLKAAGRRMNLQNEQSPAAYI